MNRKLTTLLCGMALFASATVTWGATMKVDSSLDQMFIGTSTLGATITYGTITNTTEWNGRVNALTESDSAPGDFSNVGNTFLTSANAVVNGQSTFFGFDPSVPPDSAISLVSVAASDNTTAGLDVVNSATIARIVQQFTLNIDATVDFTATLVATFQASYLLTDGVKNSQGSSRWYFSLAGPVPLTNSSTGALYAMFDPSTMLNPIYDVDGIIIGYNNGITLIDPVEGPYTSYTQKSSVFSLLNVALLAGDYTMTWGLDGTTSVPEPGTFVLAGAGLLGLIALKRRSRKA